MLSTDQERVSEELVEKWGERTGAVLRQLNALIGEALAQRDLVAFGFITQATAKLMTYAIEIAKGIQEQDGGHDGEVLH